MDNQCSDVEAIWADQDTVNSCGKSLGYRCDDRFASSTACWDMSLSYACLPCSVDKAELVAFLAFNRILDQSSSHEHVQTLLVSHPVYIYTPYLSPVDEPLNYTPRIAHNHATFRNPLYNAQPYPPPLH
jgi:hypothetical protein